MTWWFVLSVVFAIEVVGALSRIASAQEKTAKAWERYFGDHSQPEPWGPTGPTEPGCTGPGGETGPR